VSTPAKKMGRKPLPPGLARTARLELRLHADDLYAWRAMAADKGVNLTRWIELACAEKLLRDAK
jgi:hypothetical protein